MMITRLIRVCLMMAVSCAFLPANHAETGIRVMLLTGQMNRHHNWETCSAVLLRHLEDAGIFDVNYVTTPPRGADMSGFAPRWSDYQVVVMDYDGDEWPEPTKRAFVKYMQNGGGLVTVHSTDNAFPHWPEWLEMTGLGGWGGRDETWGPMVRWRHGEMVLDHGPGAAKHPPRHDFLITIRDTLHPVMKDMPENWLHAHDEVYSQLRGPARNLHVLATAFADPELRNSTGENEPVLFTISYGKGRVFHTTLGHVGAQETGHVPSIMCVGFITTFQRGVEWAATGTATIPVPDDFPSAYRTSVREY